MRLFLNLTDKCNLNCRYCLVAKDRKRSLDFQTACRAIDLLFEKKHIFDAEKKEVIFVGGEPLLEFALVKKIAGYVRKLADFKKTEIKIGFPTNGLLLDEGKLIFFEKNGIGVAVSFDGPGIFNKNRQTGGGQNSFELLEEKLPLFLRFKKIIRVAMTIYPDQAKFLWNNFLYFAGLGFNDLNFQPVTGFNWPKISQDEYLANLKKIILFSNKGKRLGKNFRIKCFSEIVGSQKVSNRRCPKGFSEILVETDGSILPCQFFIALPEAQRKKFRLGDVFGEANSEIFKNMNCSKICECSDFFGPQLKKKCRVCKESRACSMPCLGYSIKERKFDLSLMENNFQFERRIENLTGRYLI